MSDRETIQAIARQAAVKAERHGVAPGGVYDVADAAAVAVLRELSKQQCSAQRVNGEWIDAIPSEVIKYALVAFTAAPVTPEAPHADHIADTSQMVDVSVNHPFVAPAEPQTPEHTCGTTPMAHCQACADEVEASVMPFAPPVSADTRPARTPGDVAWLIERYNGPRLVYWTGRKGEDFSTDANWAVRFSRYEDAEQVRGHVVPQGETCRSVEHAWLSGGAPHGR